MDHASTINFLSNEDTPELAPGYFIISNLHTHSLFCDGKNTVEELCGAAFRLGLTSLGFSAHAPMPFVSSWHLKNEHLNRYVDTVRAAGDRWRGRLEVFLGLEIDYVKDLCGPGDGRFSGLGLDYAIGSVHYLIPPRGKPFTIDGHYAEVDAGIQAGYGGNGTAAVLAYWDAVAAMAEKAPPDIVGHLDLIRRQNGRGQWFREDDDTYQRGAIRAIAAIASSGAVVELNTGGMLRGGLSEPYPALALLPELRRRSVPMTINSDAHASDQLDGLYQEACAWLAAAGFKQRRVFQRGSWLPIDL